MLFYITLLGFIVTFLLLIHWRQSNRANIYLFFFFLLNNTYAFAHYAAIYSKNQHLVAIMLVNFTPLFVLAGPALYFYVRGVFWDDYTLKKIDFIHFLPAIIYFINIAGYLFSSYDHKLEFANRLILDPKELLSAETWFISGTISFILRPLLALGYVLYCIYLLIQFYKENEFAEKQYTLIYKWLIFLLGTALLVYGSFLLFSISGIQATNYQEAEETGRFFLTLVLSGMIALNVSLLFFPNILYGLPQLDFAIQSKWSKAKPNIHVEPETPQKQVRSFEISQEKLDLLKFKIEKYMVSKPFLSADFNLTTMSIDTDIPIHHLSYYFNEHLNVNFNTWKNDLKINHVIKLIQDGSGELLTLDALAKQSGFGSRTSFFNSFKQKMGVTPSEYLNGFK